MINSRNIKRSSILAGLIILVIAIGGTSFLISSHAATPYASINADKGVLSGDTIVKSDSSASDGEAVEFGNTNTSTISSDPSGPAVPSGGWSVVYADDFNDPLGTGSGQDNTWWPGPPLARGDNPTYDLSSNSNTQASVSGGNLLITAKYSSSAYQAANSSDPATNYLSDQLDTTTGESGYKGFDWYPETDATWAFQISTEWPLNTNDLFNSFYSYAEYSTGSADERDFFEGRPWNGSPEQYWIDSDTLSPVNDFCYYSNSSSCEGEYTANEPFNPSADYHTYTYEVFPGGSWSLYIDGVVQTWADDRPAADNQTDNKPMMLILDYMIMGGDNQSTTDPGFTSGSRSMKINNIAVYQNTTAKGAGVVDGGLAPGTTISGQ